MRSLMMLVMALATLYGGYWFVGSAGVKRGAFALQERLAQQGWQAQWADLRVQGFPSRFDTELEAPSLTDTAGTFGWQAPLLEILALSYRPNEVILAFPPAQEIVLPDQRLDVDSARMRASAKVAAALSLPLDHATLEAESLKLRSSLGWQARADKLLFAFRQGAAPEHYDLYLSASPVVLPAEVMRLVDPQAQMPAAIATLRADMTLGFDAPLALARAGEPALQSISVREVQLDWGEVSLSGLGDLAIGADGRPEGRILLTLSDWPRAIELAVAAGFIRPEIAPTWQAAAETLAEGDPLRLQIPLTFFNGRMSLGPLPLGPAPVLTRS